MPNQRARHVAAFLATLGLFAALARAQDAPPAAPTPSPRPSARPAPPPDVYHLRNGDRITGRTIARNKRSFAVQTPFGRLTLPRARVAKVVRADGSEEVLHPADAAGEARPAAAMPVPAPRPTAGTGRLAVAITGKTFWQAWDPRESGRDPTLRLELRLDEDAVVVYVDALPDPDQIPGALVNAFSFAEGLAVSPAPGVRVHPAEVRPGRILLKLDVRARARDARRLRIAYQLNAGTAGEPAWKDVVSSATEVTIDPDRPALVEVRQERGRMEFAGFPRRRMRHVETFLLSLTAASEPAAAP
ncbi:MAG TPA: hypothetical protein VMT87_14930 [Vicinamibacteria bacterium]|nr:hypothetical protein [Vicinamibacteria bacterium]